MLYEDLTTGALIAGFVAQVDSITGAEAEALQATLNALNTQHKVRVKMIVPGDSCTDHAENPDEELYASQFVFGLSVAQVNPWDAPYAVPAAAPQNALKQAQAIPAAFWDDLREQADSLPSDFAKGSPSLFFTCYGPLPYAALAYGAIIPADDRGSAHYTFFSVQDMDQEWLPDGVDGVRIASCEYTSVSAVDLSEAKLAEYAAKVPEYPDARLYITVRYD